MAQVMVKKQFTGEGIASEVAKALFQLWQQGIQVPEVTAFGNWNFRGRSIDLAKTGENVNIPVGSKIVHIGGGSSDLPVAPMVPTKRSMIEIVTVAEGKLVDKNEEFTDDVISAYYTNRKPRGRKSKADSVATMQAPTPSK